MLVDAGSVVHALRLPADTQVETEPAGPGVERWVLCPPGATPVRVMLRAHGHAEFAANHMAVVDALHRAGFRHMPRPLAALGGAVVEEAIAGITALSLAPPDGSAEAAIAALAALHALETREGLNWGTDPTELLPAGPPPLHRLGFAAHERDAAAAPLARAREAVLASQWGFAHGDAIASNVLLAPGHAWLVSFHAAGFHPQLFDVAAFLLTSGLGAAERRALAERYAALRGTVANGMADLIDLAGIVWGVGELLVLPRRSIELLGDDAALAGLNTAAMRIERGLREPASGDPTAAAIRAALWPS